MSNEKEHEWNLIKKALENPQYKWRTVYGIAKETGYDVPTVVSSINAHVDTVVASGAPANDGLPLFTTRGHYKEKSTFWDRIEAAITNKVQR